MTDVTPLKSLTITAFRGSTTSFILPFEKGRKLTLVYGENGTGKTTICDAFEFLAHERVSSLDKCGLGNGLEKYWPAAGKNAGDITIELATSSGACFGTIVGKTVNVTPVTSRPKIELLRRQQILNLIQAQPKERYDAIKRFIDIADFEVSEEALRQQSKALVTDRKTAEQAEGQSLQELQSFYETAGESAGLNAVAWAKKKLDEPTVDLDSDITAIAELRSALEALRTFPERTEKAQNTLAEAITAHRAAETVLLDAAAAITSGAVDILAVLEAGSKYLHSHPKITECPLCRSQENVAGLANDLATRLADLEVLRTATKNCQQCAMAETAARNILTELGADYAKARGVYMAQRYIRTWKAGMEFPSDDPPADLSLLISWLKINTTVFQTWPTLEASLRDEKKFLQALTAAFDRYERNRTKSIELTALVPKLENALKLCIEQRQAFTNKIIGEIAQAVGKLYEEIHPGEGLDQIALPLDPKKRASIELEARFSGQDVPPQAYFSQSHLDTLGLCVFLALAIRDQPGDTILILDDVLGSIDEPHVERVIDMIYEISTRFRHTIVTTHYRPWREKYRWGVLKPDQICQFVELKSWTLDEGIKRIGAIPEIERLRALLVSSDPDVQSIVSKAGVILEALLDFLTLKYGCAVPRRFASSYTLGDLLPAINGKLLSALKVEELDPSGKTETKIVELKPIIDQIKNIAQTRNVMGAHFNAVSFNLYPQDGIKFAQLVERLGDALICPDYGWPTKNKSGSYWSNGGDTRRLHPLTKPS